MNQMTDQQRADSFMSWYSSAGHWVYNGLSDAVRTWRDRGIAGRPAYRAGAEALLADKMAADDKFLATLRAAA